jgi:hypothetical protein
MPAYRGRANIHDASRKVARYTPMFSRAEDIRHGITSQFRDDLVYVLPNVGNRYQKPALSLLFCETLDRFQLAEGISNYYFDSLLCGWRHECWVWA